jgi:predicted DNA-binding protein
MSVRRSENVTTNMKTEMLYVRVSEEDKIALAELSKKLDKPASQIIREEIRDRLAEEEKEDAAEVAING